MVSAIRSGASLIPWKLSVPVGKLCVFPQQPPPPPLCKAFRPCPGIHLHQGCGELLLCRLTPLLPTAPCLPGADTGWHRSPDMLLLQCFFLLLLPSWLPAREGRKRHGPPPALPLLSKHPSWSWDRVCGTPASRPVSSSPPGSPFPWEQPGCGPLGHFLLF